MRQPVVVAIALAVLPAIASADKKAAETAANPIDVAPVSEKLTAYKDDIGNLYVLPRPGKFDDIKEAQKWAFVGDGKLMYQQRTNSLTPRKDGYDLNVWSPRAKDMPTAELTIAADGATVACRRAPAPRRSLVALSADETRTLLAKAKFMPPLWIRDSHFLARDDDANYYYVDVLLPGSGGNGYHVFIGPQGAMKQVGLTNIASDSVGEIFATKEGKLKITAGKEAVAVRPGVAEATPSKDPTAFWIKGGKKIELTVVPTYENRYLIYRELGIYGALGVACDDQ